MDKEIVIVVPNETSAYEVVKALKALDDEGSIELYSSTVLAKSKDGAMSIKDTRHLHGGWGPLLGLSTGALIGLLGGPVGMAVGAAVGGVAGLGGDLAYSGFAGDFVRDVAKRLEPGHYAVCASVWEDWAVPVDVAVAPFGAVVSRQGTDDVVMAQIRGEMKELKEEQAYVDAEIARATGEAKAKLEARRSELRAKQAAQRERLQKRVTQIQESWDAKIASVKKKAADAKAAAKTRHQEHAEKLSRFAALQKESFRELFS
jgi:uncharacterized membrane protein